MDHGTGQEPTDSIDDSPTLTGAVTQWPVRPGSPGIGEALGVLAAAPLFKAFEPGDLDAIVNEAAAQGRLHLARYADGTTLFHEGDPAVHVLLIRSGHVRIVKHQADGSEVEINRLGTGDSLGELALIDPAPRSASARATGTVDVLALPIGGVLALAIDRPSVAVGLLGVARVVTERLRRSTDGVVATLERALQEQRTRATMGRFTLLLIIAYSMYSWVLGTAVQVKQALGRSELVSVPVVLVTVGFILAFMRGSGYPPRFFGLSREGWLRHSLEALALTLPWLAAVVALKALLIGHLPSMHDAPLFQMGSAAGGPAARFDPLLALAYLLLAPLQELICRGGLQSALEHFLTGRWRVVLAIVGSNTVFSAAHLYVSPGLSVTAFVAGLFWGWLYHRQRTLVGVSVSHLVLGFFAFEVVDLGVLE